jgi:hypothetical protein
MLAEIALKISLALSGLVCMGMFFTALIWRNLGKQEPKYVVPALSAMLLSSFAALFVSGVVWLLLVIWSS